MRNLRILLWNIGYASGVTGSLPGYVKGLPRMLRSATRPHPRCCQSVADLVSAYEPDVCCFLEIHQGSPLIEVLSDAFAHHDISNKYGPHARRLPFHRRNGNGVFTREAPAAVERHYLENGFKKLLHEVSLDIRTSLFVHHGSLRQATRRKQLEELHELVSGRPRVILCGDFNALQGTGDLEDFAESAGLRLITRDLTPSYPAHRPRKHLNHILCSPDIGVRSCQVLSGVRGSDHLPVLAELMV